MIQVDGFWLEAGEIRFRRLGGVVGFALGEIARLLPQEAESVRGRLAVRFVRRLGPDRVEVRLRQELKRVQLIGVEPVLALARVAASTTARSRIRGPGSTVGSWSTSSSIASDPGRTGTGWPTSTCRAGGC